MVEKSVQTLQVDRTRQRGDFSVSQEREQQWERRPQKPRAEIPQTRRATGANMKSGPGVPNAQQETLQQNDENRPTPSRKQVLKFDTDFDFDLSNAQFVKEELEREVHGTKDENPKGEEKGKEQLLSTAEDDPFGPKCYYDKAKCFFDNISSDTKFRQTWAEERKRNMETFGVPGRFLRGQGFRGGYSGRRGRGTAQTQSSYRTRSGQL
ncbi:hypothetical protein KUCAC02_012661 [Chaenocephalus aceratus]|uniref:Uncharacterized protein n=1 Tax=Chaenocephalus aceratus TaxID=36190 RepID=A0ACB9XBB0_CHAAC|nr:hypothetical protein KUCAC02_012661 [Chaenocephalus aceratus]